jgi:uncharacterized protein (TIGR02231 family)
MKTILFFSFMLFTGTAFAHSVVVNAPIVKVSVFKDRALVMREIQVKLEKGSHRLLVNDLTPLLSDDTVKVMFEGDRRGSLLSVMVDDEHRLHDRDQSLEELHRKFDQNREATQALLNDLSEIVKKLDIVHSMEDQYRETFATKFNKGLWDAGSFQKFLSYLNEIHGVSREQWKTLDRRFQRLNEEGEMLQAEIATQSSVADKHTKSVQIEVDCDTASQHRFLLSYLVTNAGWRSEYDVRVDTHKNNAEFTHFGKIEQTTGENWENVSLELSTVLSELKLNVPSISSYEVQARKVQKIETHVESARETTGVLEKADVDNSLDSSADDFAKTHRIDGRFEIKSGIRAVRVPIAKAEVSVDTELRTFPFQMRNVYQHGSFKNPFAWNLHPGKLNMYRDGEFIGQARVAQIPTGGRFDLNLGIDHSIIVGIGTEDHSIEVNPLVLTKKMQRKYFVNLRNFHREPKTVRVMLQVPISEIKEVQVDIDAQDFSDYKLEGSNETIGWKNARFTIPAREFKNTTLAVTVSSPKTFEFSFN